ncbi:hypothetical protein [uncultured Pseudoteredinibacter sp.]|uniref:hypothetical protein n=1 Tax=uncultured Pseudoteredinibacter sp. TaxID=1641701 RepID=UPI002628ACC1|nr:hypothetical protein [uncultured Pseudoteredinibacter sp.]
MRIKNCIFSDVQSIYLMVQLSLLGTLVLSSYSYAYEDKPVINWVALDIPPFEISYGPNKGKGYVDRIRNRFIKELPQYRHSSPTLVNQQRFFRLLSTGDYCHSTMRRTDAFNKIAIQSIPHFTGFSDVIITFEKNAQKLSKYGVPVPLHKILKDGDSRLGVPSRTMGKILDEIFREHGTEENLLTRSSSQVGKELLTLLQKNRIDFTIDYPSAKRSWETNLQAKGLISLPIKELEELIPIGYITCSNTELGRQIIKDSNRVIYRLLKDPKYVQDFILNAYPKELQHIVQERVENHIQPALERYRESTEKDSAAVN